LVSPSRSTVIASAAKNGDLATCRRYETAELASGFCQRKDISVAVVTCSEAGGETSFGASSSRSLTDILPLLTVANSPSLIKTLSPPVFDSTPPWLMRISPPASGLTLKLASVCALS
jgi:hypothetical protein